MTKKLMGLFASVALMSSGMAFAHEDKAGKDKQTQSQSGTGGSGTQGTGQSGSMQGSEIGGSGAQTGSGSQVGSGTQTGRDVGSGARGNMGQQQDQMGQSGTLGQSGTQDQLSGNQITGRVVKSDRKMVWVEHAGAIVPLKIDKNTQFTDPNLKRAADIKEGDQIRASFEVRKTDNVATSIGMSSGMGQGGSGSDVLKPDQGINQPSDGLPPSPGTGGSGRDDLGGEINEGISPDSGLGTSGDVGQDQGTRTGDY